MYEIAPDDFRQRLTEYLEAVTGEAITVTALQAMPGGISRETWLVSLSRGGLDERLVLRRDTAMAITDKALERDQEFQVMQTAHAAGVCVPRPRWFCAEPAILGAPFLVMDYVEGRSIGAEVATAPELAAARPRLPQQLGAQLARIHAINPAQAALSFLPAPHPDLSPALDTLIQIRAILTRLSVYNPAFAFGLRWAETRLPESAETVLLHGDYRMGNFIVAPDGLRGIVDWEFARMGDPHEELAWPCVRVWRFGDGAQRLGGIAQREPFLQAYEAASGRSINRRSVDFWEVVGCLRWAALSLAQAERHRSGRDRSVELAALGRRSAEMQLEMLRLIDDLG